MRLRTVSFREHFVAVQCALRPHEYIPNMLEDADKVARACCKKWGHEESETPAGSLITKTCARCGGPI